MRRQASGFIVIRRAQVSSPAAGLRINIIDHRPMGREGAGDIRLAAAKDGVLKTG